MPKMPDKAAIEGGAETLRGQRGIVSASDVDASAIGRGLATMGRGMQSGIDDLRRGQEKAQREQDALDLIKADAAQRQGLFDAERALDNDGDYSTHDQRFTPVANEINTRAADLIRNPEMREKWRLKAGNDVLGVRERLQKRADEYGRQERFVQLESTLEKYRDDYSNPATPDSERSRILDQMRTSIQLGQRAGMLSPVQQQKLDEQYVKGAVIQEAERRKLDDPEGLRRDLLGGAAPQGELEPGNIDLDKRPVVRNDDGTISTIKSMSINEDGREVLIPTIDENGKEMTEDEAIERYLGTGQHLGKFDSADNATAWAKSLSDRQGKAFRPAKGSSPMAITTRLETGKTNPRDGVKNISGDSNGSKSYGNLGLNSQEGGSAQQFMRDYGPALGLKGKPGTAEFDRSWAAVAKADPEGLMAAESDWYSKNILAPTQSKLEGAGVPTELASDPRVVAYFADRSIQQGEGSIANHAERIAAAANGAKDVRDFLAKMTEADRGKLKDDFPSALRSGVYSARGHATRLYGRYSMAMAMGDEAPVDAGAEGKYGLLSPLERAKFLNEAERGYRSKFEAHREQLKQQLDDDVESIRRTGVEAKPDLEMARRVLEPNQINRYFLNRQEAQLEHEALSDLPTLPTDQVYGRLSAIAPKPGEANYEMKAKVYDKAEKMARDLIEWRDTDPARSVDMLPDVKKAAEAANANPGDPAAVQELARVRVEAQGKVGVPEDRRSPITKQEARVIMAPIRGLEGKSLTDAIGGVIAGLEQQYGPYARAAGVAAVEQMVQNRELAEQVHGQLKRTLDGLSPSAEITNRIRYLNESGAAERAFGSFGNTQKFSDKNFRNIGDRLGDDAPTIPMQGDPNAYYGMPKPSATAIAALKGNPATASQFNQVFGPGAAEAVLADPNPLPDMLLE
jgi:hypothetical protein